MAKSKSFFGLRKGSTKSLTFQTLRGLQITKDRVAEVANPQTLRQMVQRVSFATASVAADKMRNLVSISFEGKRSEDALQLFTSINSKHLRTANAAAYSPKGNNQLIPNSYQVSRGSLVLPTIFQPRCDSDSGESFTADHYDRPGLLPALPAGEYTPAQLWQLLFSLQPGDQMTFPQVRGYQDAVQTLSDAAGNILDKTIATRWQAPRFVLLSADAMPATTLTVNASTTVEQLRTALRSAIDDDNSYPELVDVFITSIAIDGFADNALTAALFYEYDVVFGVDRDVPCRAIGAILSRRDAKRVWRYSTCRLVCVWSPIANDEGRDYFGFTQSNAIATYLKSVKQDAEGNFLQSGGTDDIIPVGYITPGRHPAPTPTPALTFSPALPWSGTQRGTIHLAQPITQEQFLAGELRMTIVAGGEETFTATFDATQPTYITIAADGQVVWLVDKWQGETSELVLRNASDDQQFNAFQLTNVERLTEVPAIEIYTDVACTQHPVVGEEYDHFYVKLNRSFLFGETAVYQGSNYPTSYEDQCGVFTPTDLNPGDTYNIELFVDFFSTGSTDSPFLAGAVVEVKASEDKKYSSGWHSSYGTTYV